MHAQADIVVTTKPRLAGVHPHSDPHRGSGGPGRSAERALAMHRGLDGLGWLSEDGEEGVPLGRQLAALGCANSLPENRVVALKDARVPVAQRGGKTGAAL